MAYQRATHITERRTFPHFPTSQIIHAFSSQPTMQIQTNEARIILATEAVRSSSETSIRKATKIYEVPEATLRHRIDGRTPRNETRANCHKLTEVEEEVIV